MWLSGVSYLFRLIFVSSSLIVTMSLLIVVYSIPSDPDRTWDPDIPPICGGFSLYNLYHWTCHITHHETTRSLDDCDSEID